MRILVLGATGATGALLTRAALDDGHEVVAVVRDPAKLSARAGLRVVGGDVTDAGLLASEGRGADALIGLLGSRSMRRPDGLIARSSRAIVEAAARGGPRRVVLQSAFGAGDSSRKASPLLRLGHFAAAPMFRDKDEGERVPGTPRVSRADVARFVLDAAVDGTWVGRVVVLSRG